MSRSDLSCPLAPSRLVLFFLIALHSTSDTPFVAKAFDLRSNGASKKPHNPVPLQYHNNGWQVSEATTNHDPATVRAMRTPTTTHTIPTPDMAATCASAYSHMTDLTSALGEKVAAYNAATLDPAQRIQLLAKLERDNPGSLSHKDRIAREILRQAERRGELTRPDGQKKTIIAASSGNTGHALATIGTQLGYEVVIITNKKCSKEKCDNIRNAGATLWLAEDLPDMFPDELTGVTDYMEQEHVLAAACPDCYFSVNQYGNLDNMGAHYATTGPEVWAQSGGRVTHFVMAASTGGSIMGVGKFLKEQASRTGRDIQVILSDPHKSKLAGILAQARGDTSKGNAILQGVADCIARDGSGVQIEGAGKESLTDIMKVDGEVLKYVDAALPIHDFDAFDKCREVADASGLMLGGSAGLNVAACQKIAEDLIDQGKAGGTVLTTLLCDAGEKYQSKIFNEDWIAKHDTRPNTPSLEVDAKSREATEDEGYRIDPANWDEYRSQMHSLVDACCDRMQSYRALPWIQPPDQYQERVAIDPANDGRGRTFDDVSSQLMREIMPYATGNTHPAFMGWVHGAGMPSCVAADLISSTMNSNCGGRHHGAIEVERACINWLCERLAGFTPQINGETILPFGVLTTGTSQATILALMSARTKLFGVDVRKKGVQGLPPVRVYVSEAAHSCITRAMECIGHGSESVVRIPTDPATGKMNLHELEKRLAQDKFQGIHVMAIVGTAGSVSIGAYDDLNRLADIAGQHNTWFHVDAAFGIWTRLSADPSIRALSDGIERADSIGMDTHKWPGVQYDCAALLVRNQELLRSTLATRPAYLQSASQGLAGGDLWFTDFSLDLSRGNRAVKLWTALQTAGADALGAVVTDNCDQAKYMGELVKASPVLELAHPVISNICCFSIRTPGVSVAEVAAELQLQGKGVFSTIQIGEKSCLRAAIVNHRMTRQDISNSIAAVEKVILSMNGNSALLS